MEWSVGGQNLRIFLSSSAWQNHSSEFQEPHTADRPAVMVALIRPRSRKRPQIWGFLTHFGFNRFKKISTHQRNCAFDLTMYILLHTAGFSAGKPIQHDYLTVLFYEYKEYVSRSNPGNRNARILLFLRAEIVVPVSFSNG